MEDLKLIVQRKCTECDSGEVEGVKHFLLRCKAWNRERKEFMEHKYSIQMHISYFT